MYKYKWILALCILSMIACDSNYKESAASPQLQHIGSTSDELQAEKSSDFNGAKNEKDAKSELKIITEGNIIIEVSDIKKSKILLDAIVLKHKAYFSNDNYYKTESRINANLTIRIPSSNFERFLLDLENQNGSIISKNIRARDVSEEYRDQSIRFENQKEFLEQYRVLLKKANSIKDILDIQERIRRLVEEIDVSKGRLQYIDNKVDYTTLQLEMYEEIAVTKKGRKYGKQLVSAFQRGFDGVLGFGLLLITLWPILIVGIVGFSIWKYKGGTRSL